MMPPTEPFRVLVCGGRTFGMVPRGPRSDPEALDRALFEAAWLERSLNRLHARLPIALLIHGAAEGADKLAGEWAASRSVPVQPCPITPEDWRRLGKSAGRVRNAYMLVEHRPHLVVAFPGGNGTAHMVSIARAAGVQVWEPRRPAVLA